jgi:hypothetical protein
MGLLSSTSSAWRKIDMLSSCCGIDDSVLGPAHDRRWRVEKGAVKGTPSQAWRSANRAIWSIIFRLITKVIASTGKRPKARRLFQSGLWS